MTNKTWVISDTHFGHARIIELAKRPFASVVEMDLEMIRQWNETVGEDDTVFHLGDFQWKDMGYFSNLKGHKILIKGNHDPAPTLALPWDAIHQYHEITQSQKRFVLFHYPIEEWNHKFHGSVHLFGHTHNQPTVDIPNRHCVCVEHIGYAPVPIESFINKENSKVE